MKRIKSLYPIPGSKRASKYDFLKPLGFQRQICEPFMGGAAKSLQTGLKPILGEINAAQRAIALAPTLSYLAEEFIHGYRTAVSCMVAGIPVAELQRTAKEKQAQKAFRASHPELAEILDYRWELTLDRLFEAIEGGEAAPGVYAFCQRACFGNVMRLSSKGTGFNVTWHIEKLCQALSFDPDRWIELLQAQHWNPTIYDRWELAIASCRKPSDTWLLLDPPYLENSGDRKMTPCYPGHTVTNEAREETYNLAIKPLDMGLAREFQKIDLCNYWSDRLDSDVRRLAALYGYEATLEIVGECDALGHSNGRLVHGDRRDTRPRPVEVVWTLKNSF